MVIPDVGQRGGEMRACIALLLENNSSKHIREMLKVRPRTPTRDLRNEYAAKRRQALANGILYSLGVNRKI
jgi:hypothetical protein